MKRLIIIFFIATMMVSCGDSTTQKTENEIDTSQNKDQNSNAIVYEPTWESLKQHKDPEWFRDAKFGIYCHWGPYSVPAYENEWYSKWMYMNPNNPEHERGKKYYEHHVKTYGTLDKFGYKDFIPMFKAENFDPEAWADLFQKAGARFAGPVSEHADGYAMWDSKLTKWDAKDTGPHRDVMGELSKAIRKRGMKFIATYHRHWLYQWYPTWDETTDASNPEYAGLYGDKTEKMDFQYPKNTHKLDAGEERYIKRPGAKFDQEWWARLKEIIDNYEPDLIWFDNRMDIIDEQVRRTFLAYYYNKAEEWNKEVAVTYKFYDLAKGTAILDVERARMSEAKDFPWLTDDSIDWKAWSHISDPDYKSTNRLIDVLVDIVSKNGCLLLNITPKANGDIPQPVQERLLQMGDWLTVNGEAIYGTRPFSIYGEGPAKVVEGHLSERQNADNTSEDIRFTQAKDGTLYAIVLDWPKDGKVKIRALGSKDKAKYYDGDIKQISLLGMEGHLTHETTEDYLLIKLPKEKQGRYAHVLKFN